MYTVTEAARLLKLHPKTLRRKIQQGEIESTRLGKQYRITVAQLEAYLGAELAPDSAIKPETSRRVFVSSVIDLHAISPEESSRISNYLLASQKNAGMARGRNPTRIDSIYEPEFGYLKVLISGDSDVVRGLLKLIETLTSPSDQS